MHSTDKGEQPRKSFKQNSFHMITKPLYTKDLKSPANNRQLFTLHKKCLVLIFKAKYELGQSKCNYFVRV